MVLQQVTKKVSKGLHTNSVLRNVSTARWSLPTGLLYKIHLTACCHSKLTHNPSPCPLHHPILLMVPLTSGQKLNYFHQKREDITYDSKWSCTLKGRLQLLALAQIIKTWVSSVLSYLRTLFTTTGRRNSLSHLVSKNIGPGAIEWLNGESHLLPSPMTWVWSPGIYGRRGEWSCFLVSRYMLHGVNICKQNIENCNKNKSNHHSKQDKMYRCKQAPTCPL